MKYFLFIILLIIVYLGLVGIFGVAIEILLFIFFDIELNQGPLKLFVLVISWVLPYLLIDKIRKYFSKDSGNNETS